MYLAPATLEPDLVDRLSGIVQATGVALLAGWLGGRLVGVGVRARGLPLLYGLLGLYAGSWLWSVGGWDGGPTVGGYGIVPALAGALAVAGVVRLVELAVPGPRW